MLAAANLTQLFGEVFTGLRGPPASGKRLVIGSKIYLYIGLPFVLLPTGLSHISQATSGWQPEVPWTLTWAWLSCAALVLCTNVAVLFLRGSGRVARWLTLASFAGLLGTNQMTMLAVGSLTSWGVLYIVALTAGYRVFGDFRLALFGTVVGAVFLIAGAIVEWTNMLPLAAHAPNPIAHPYYADLGLAISTVLVAILSVFTAFFVMNYGMNQSLKLHRYMTDTVLQRYLPPALVKRAASGELRLDEPAERRVVTVLFTDLMGFTALSERLGPDAVAGYLSTYLSAMANLAHDHGATVDKFVGDAVMVVYGAPERMAPEEQARRTVQLALAMISLTASLPGERLQLRAGVNTGEAIVGNFGSEHRSDYTVIGPAVNLAARLEAVATPGRVLIGPATAALLTGASLESVEPLKLKGFAELVEACYCGGVPGPE